MTSATSHSRDKINQRLLSAPGGAVLTLSWLKSQGISPKLATHYAKSGWLHRVGEGAFTLTSASPNWLGGVFGLQQKTTTLHPGGRTALELEGLSHFLPLGAQGPVYLFSPAHVRLPSWLKHLPWSNRVRHVRTSFLPPEIGLREYQTGNFSVRISDPERAILEFLFHQKWDASGYEHAKLLFEGLGTLRASLVQELLEKCTSVKVKRLFLHLAETQNHSWFKDLDPTKISLGSGKRVLVAGGKLDPKYLITVPTSHIVPDDAP